ncbi:energy-coupling factor transporter transmembrane protein EcfT [candidate division KSB1 bacterium]|nr:energy-coupling factor transporter transmembrane protein EcfT [candidate division KSB1 bacterium]
MAFLSDITLGQYFPADSFVHRLDPRTKMLSLLAAMTALVLAHSVLKLGFSFFLLFLIIKVSRIPLSIVLRNLKPFIWLFFITLIFHIFLSGEGTELVKIPVIGLTVTKEGLRGGSIYSIRLAEFVMMASLLTLTTSPVEITDALDRFFSPLKKLGLPTHEFTLMITLSLRFIPTLISEADKLRKAQISRGATLEGNIIQRIKSVVPLILPLFISVFRRADELALAMDARCYTGGKNRTSFKNLTFAKSDFVVITCSLIYLILFVIV